MIIKRLDIDTLEQKQVPLTHHKLGLQLTASGYGKQLPTERMVRLPNSKRWRRVYCCIYSNIGTCYIKQGKNWIVVY